MVIIKKKKFHENTYKRISFKCGDSIGYDDFEPFDKRYVDFIQELLKEPGNTESEYHSIIYEEFGKESVEVDPVMPWVWARESGYISIQI